MKSIDINEVSQRLLPITDLRRNTGEVFDKLNKVGFYIVTKDGKPIAQIRPITQKRGKGKFRSSYGAWKNTELNKIDFYSLILKWRKEGTRRNLLKHE